MSDVVDAGLLPELRSYGAFDISACFNCGNCSAVCPLSDGEGSFPRRMIRLGQLGLRDRLLAGREAWLCYACGECTATCPRQAGPSDYMAALRRWSAARHEPTGLGRLMHRGAWGVSAVTLGLGAALAAALLTVPAPPSPPQWIFRAVPYGAIHEVGLAVSALLAVSLAWSLGRFLRRADPGFRSLSRPLADHRAAAKATLRELVQLRRWAPAAPGRADPGSPRAAHMLIAGGFMALLAATSLDFVFIYLLKFASFPPARVLGTLGGAALLLGVSAALLRRARAADPAVRRSHAADWWLLGALWFLAVSGFWLEADVGLRVAGAFQDGVLLLHVVAALELILLLGSGKLAHVVYRPLSLYLHYLDGGSASAGGCGGAVSRSAP